MTLTGRVAIVTGGTGALGQAVTLRLLAEGAHVWVPYVVDAERTHLAGRVPAAPAERLTLVPADVTDTAAMTGLAEAVLAKHHRIDVLVAGVGGFAGGGLVETDRDTWDRMLAMNLTSLFVAARAIVPAMLSGRHGRVIAIASRAVLPPAGGFIAYTVAKAGVVAFVQALAREVAGTGVTANAVAPSTMDTPANRAAMPDADPRTWVPLERVADAIAFLARDEAAHVNGTVLRI
jgi:NAD(P)-dependent dehydrogenase (short-subunit alcohol dehydrogenase family)